MDLDLSDSSNTDEEHKSDHSAGSAEGAVTVQNNT